MSLVKCPECGKEISNMAKRCINCGVPLRKVFRKTTVKSVVKIVLGILNISFSIIPFIQSYFNAIFNDCIFYNFLLIAILLFIFGILGIVNRHNEKATVLVVFMLSYTIGFAISVFTYKKDSRILDCGVFCFIMFIFYTLFWFSSLKKHCIK